MNGLNVNYTVAGVVSQRLSQAASVLANSSAPTATASKTNVSGNKNAQRCLQRMPASSQAVSNALTRDGNNIHSVSQEFAAIDQKLSKGFDGLSQLPRPGKSGF
ncbi:TIGR04197 family type VII secretion effector [Enterococcus sp. LJL128]|uniref:TIGR04197 family type VII secretion effector n=1 Tax=Enterococcus sp. LJL51 TaxID=3416656 RepID=UPI003CEA6691